MVPLIIKPGPKLKLVWRHKLSYFNNDKSNDSTYYREPLPIAIIIKFKTLICLIIEKSSANSVNGVQTGNTEDRALTRKVSQTLYSEEQKVIIGGKSKY